MRAIWVILVSLLLLTGSATALSAGSVTSQNAGHSGFEEALKDVISDLTVEVSDLEKENKRLQKSLNDSREELLKQASDRSVEVRNSSSNGLDAVHNISIEGDQETEVDIMEEIVVNRTGSQIEIEPEKLANSGRSGFISSFLSGIFF